MLPQPPPRAKSGGANRELSYSVCLCVVFLYSVLLPMSGRSFRWSATTSPRMRFSPASKFGNFAPLPKRQAVWIRVEDLDANLIGTCRKVIVDTCCESESPVYVVPAAKPKDPRPAVPPNRGRPLVTAVKL
jgi:hypothetical protein